jgi:phosphoglycolate phosphatase-like HAD superfamily hydrolase
MLLLFDIDGTLLKGATDAHKEALNHALEVVHGVHAEVAGRPIDPAGRTDGEIARLILLDAGVSAERIDARADDVRIQCGRAYSRLCPADLSAHVMPGIAELLGWLGARDDVTLSLVTGNYESVARLKLARAGIGSWFDTNGGAFGSDSEDRAALPKLARRRAGSRGHPYPRDQTLVIGDTPRDIACARADELRCIAMSTGPYPAEELTGADAVVPDAAGLRDELERLLRL